MSEAVKDGRRQFSNVRVETGCMKSRGTPELMPNGSNGIAEGRQGFGIPSGTSDGQLTQVSAGKKMGKESD